MTTLGVTTVDLARAQFGLTSLYHFLFVPLTLGLAPLVAIMQTIWYRTGDEAWLRLTRFFGTLLLINFAIGVATGLVQEFQFGMNWSVYSEYVGGVFGAPLAIEGLAAFFLEATFLGLWVFGWDRLSRRVHLATIWLVAFGTWLSAYFILVANSWMQHPVGSSRRRAARPSSRTSATCCSAASPCTRSRTRCWSGLTTGSLVVLGVSCWHLARGRNVELFRRAAALALIVAVPVTTLNMAVGSRFGTGDDRLPADEDRRRRGAVGHREARELLALPDRRLLARMTRPRASTSSVPHLLSFLATGSFTAQVDGLNQVQAQDEQQYGPGNYIPPVGRPTGRCA